MVIRDRWKNVGMGFMPEHVGTLMRLAVVVSAVSPVSGEGEGSAGEGKRGRE